MRQRRKLGRIMFTIIGLGVFAVILNVATIRGFFSENWISIRDNYVGLLPYLIIFFLAILFLSRRR